MPGTTGNAVTSTETKRKKTKDLEGTGDPPRFRTVIAGTVNSWFSQSKKNVAKLNSSVKVV